MRNRFPHGLILVAIVVSSVAGGVWRPKQDQPERTVHLLPPPNETAVETPSNFVGTDHCVICHRQQTHAWSETNHALAFEHLPLKYRDDASCLECHSTGFGESGGYYLGMPEDQAKPFLNVGCETCHGPGAAHEQAVQRWMQSEPADEERLLAEMKTAIVRTPSVSQCAACHSNQAHQSHPPYDGQPPQTLGYHTTRKVTAASIVFPSSPDSYSVKTCGSCHLTQYRQWQNGQHIDLAARLPLNYQRDESCLKCHRQNLEPWDWYEPGADPAGSGNVVGVGCESCHGPALKHVLFNKQFIGGPRLGPELEEAARQTIRQGQPAGGCVQCHVRDGHQAHPAYEKPESTSVK